MERGTIFSYPSVSSMTSNGSPRACTSSLAGATSRRREVGSLEKEGLGSGMRIQ